MATITEDYVSFETAKLLKEKGFDGECSMVYTIEGELLFAGLLHHNLNITSNTHSKYFSDIITTSPTLQMAMKWLREVHNIHISVCPFNRELPITENTSYTCDIATKKDSAMRGRLRGTWKTYERACEAAIKYCLENLI